MSPNRRRLLLLACGAAAVPLLQPAGAGSIHRWTGTALGADAEIRLAGLDDGHARQLVDSAVAEVERLEAIFSLYRPESELSRLNRDGVLRHPSHDFRLLMEESLFYWRSTEGAFNPAIQPLWHFLAEHFSATCSDPDQRQLRDVLARCDPAKISISPSRIALRPGMALTFNGIGQGYITDRVADMLRAEGVENVLVNLGELRALPGRAWPVGVDGRAARLALTNCAIAQSSERGTRFTEDGRWHHLIDPASGRSPRDTAAVTVSAFTATQADALSTALFVLPPARHRAVMAKFDTASII